MLRVKKKNIIEYNHDAILNSTISLDDNWIIKIIILLFFWAHEELAIWKTVCYENNVFLHIYGFSLSYNVSPRHWKALIGRL